MGDLDEMRRARLAAYAAALKALDAQSECNRLEKCVFLTSRLPPQKPSES